ncbi:FtsX-like permease family protein [Catellatospora tritici]|uniref:FtsX-like permease family protein n=1 Tax=Catellatospora tritici TaxID=2851566 RepID=UPI001C2D74C1|nr:FtsX-like permease family protein [Catellatospora tritici]MBV1852051.1 hypothetical protein [Catellatospora tritici]
MRASLGQLVLLGLLTAVAGVLVIGTPRIANGLTDEALRDRVASLPYLVKDLNYRGGYPVNRSTRTMPNRLQSQRDVLYPDLRNRISESWWTVYTDLDESWAAKTGLPSKAQFSLRAASGLQQETRLVDGRWPATLDEPGFPIEIVITTAEAATLHYQVGSRYSFAEAGGVQVVGIVEPVNPAAGFWDTAALALKPYQPHDDGESFKAIMFTDTAGVDRAHYAGIPTLFDLRYRVGPEHLDMAALPSMVSAVYAARSQGIEAQMEGGLDTALSRFADAARAGQALLAVVQAGTLATLAGLVLLAARLAVSRRRSEFTLLRARGGSMLTIGARTLAEVLPVVLPAAIVGWLVGRAMPGRPADTLLVLVLFALVAALATPVIAMLTLRRLSFSGEREDLAGSKVGAKRRTAELSLLVLGALGVWLVRRRGLNAADGVDVYLAAVPVLLAAGAAVLTLRAIPAPLGLVSRLASRARGAVGFLGFARSGRTAPAAVGPVAVLVVAICTTVFSLGVSGTVDAGRDRAADQAVPGDMSVSGFFFAPDTTDALAAVPGVRSVAPMLAQPPTPVTASKEIGAARLGVFYLVVVDAPRLAQVIRDSGRDLELPPGFVDARPGRPAPALLSPAVYEQFKGQTTAAADLQGRVYDFGVGGVVDSFPGLPDSSSFIVIPWQALDVRADKPISPNAFLLAGQADQATIVKVGNDGQQRWVTSIGTPVGGPDLTTRITTWTDYRAGLERTGVNGVLTFAYGVGALGGLSLALLAVAFAVLAGARARGEVLSRLRTMGLSRGQGRRLLLVELAPLVTVAVLTGAAVGVALPQLLGPALGLTTYTAGFDVGVRLDPVVVAGAVGMVLAGLLTALLVETLFNRRLRLGEVLRLGSFDAGES